MLTLISSMTLSHEASSISISARLSATTARLFATLFFCVVGAVACSARSPSDVAWSAARNCSAGVAASASSSWLLSRLLLRS